MSIYDQCDGREKVLDVHKHATIFDGREYAVLFNHHSSLVEPLTAFNPVIRRIMSECGFPSCPRCPAITPGGIVLFRARTMVCMRENERMLNRRGGLK
jgi:hypothetical protein